MAHTIIASVMCSILLCSFSFAEIPFLINYQGKVTDSGGTPVPDGTYSMRFGIYDQLLGGSPDWDSGDQNVDVSDGIFSVMLGGAGQPAIELSFDTDLWLQVGFEGDIQSPRRRLTSVGYAYMASGLVPGTEISGEVTTGSHAVIEASNTAATEYSYGGKFSIISTEGAAVCAEVFSGTGVTRAVYARNLSNQGQAVLGLSAASTGNTYGGWFESNSEDGTGLYGLSLAGSGYAYGIRGECYSTDGVAVYGIAQANSGYTCGGWFVSLSDDGLGLFYSGGLGGTGAKSCIVKTSQGPTYMYCQESPENWFEDFGEGRLINGRCHIELDPLFLETVSIDDQHPMKVFVQLGDECNGVYVRRGITGFEVVELHSGSSDASFYYRIVAKRKGFEEKRLDYCKAAESDPYLYPELSKEYQRRDR